MDNFWATFLGVILSFLLSVLSVVFFRDQKDKKALEKLVQDMAGEIEMNIMALDAFIYCLKESTAKQEIVMAGPRLSLIFYQYIVANGEFRLIPNPKLQTSIRHTTYLMQAFNDFVNNTELILAVMNLKEQTAALKQAHIRLTGLQTRANDMKGSLDDLLIELKELKLPRKLAIGFRNIKFDLRT